MGVTLTQQEFIARVNVATNFEYTPVGKYISSRTKIRMKHIVCNFECDVFSKHILSGKSHCPQCSKPKRIKKKTSMECIREKVESSNYKLHSDVYDDSKIKLDVECSNGHRYLVSLSNFNRGDRCKTCAVLVEAENQKYPMSDLLLLLKEDDSTFINWLEVYKNRDSRFIYSCNNGHIIERSVTSFRKSRGCPECNDMSKGEQRILDYLIKNNIKYKSEETFEDCISINKLPFDFIIFDEFENPKYAIEFDGKQHYEPIEWFGGIEGYKKTQKRDSIKDEYCLSNNLMLIRIPYWDFDNIDTILNALIP